MRSLLYCFLVSTGSPDKMSTELDPYKAYYVLWGIRLIVDEWTLGLSSLLWATVGVGVIEFKLQKLNGIHNRHN